MIEVLPLVVGTVGTVDAWVPDDEVGMVVVLVVVPLDDPAASFVICTEVDTDGCTELTETGGATELDGAGLLDTVGAAVNVVGPAWVDVQEASTAAVTAIPTHQRLRRARMFSTPSVVLVTLPAEMDEQPRPSTSIQPVVVLHDGSAGR